MEIDDRVVVATPEGVDLQLVVAGLGSRFLSSLVDTTLQVLVWGLLLLGASPLGAGASAAVAGLAFLAVGVAAPACFDAFGRGRTPGRRLAGLQLLSEDGAPVTLVPAVVRNVARIIDFLPALYSIGVISVLATSRNQRLGDLAAGTLVVRVGSEQVSMASPVPGSVRPARSDHPTVVPVGAWDLTGVTRDDEAVVRSFLARRDHLAADARARVAAELARRLEPVVVGPDRIRGDEAFLEQIVAARQTRSR